MKNIWVCHPLWEEKRSSALISLKNRFGRNYKGGRKQFCHKLGGKFWFKQYYKLSLLTQWIVSNFRWVYVMTLRVWLEDFGGVKGVVEGKFIGWSGMNCVSQKRREVWALKIWLCLAMPFLLNKLGTFFTIKIHYFTWCLSLSDFLIVQFWKLKKILEVHMLGGVF